MSVVLEKPAVQVDLEPQRRSVRRQLDLARHILRRCLAVEGLFWLFALIVGLAVSTLAVDWLLRLSWSTRVIVGIFALAAIAITAWRKLLRPLTMRLSDQLLADMFDKYLPGVGQKVANVLELPRLLRRPRETSPRLVQRAVSLQALELADVDFTQLLDRRRNGRLFFGILTACALPVVLFASLPEITHIWTRRWLLFEDVRWPQRTYLNVEGLGARDVLFAPHGEGLLVKVSARGNFQQGRNGWELTGRGATFVVPTRNKPTSAVPEQVVITSRTVGGVERHATFTKFASSDFRYELPPVSEETHIVIRGGDDWLGPIRVQPIHRPAIDSLKLLAQPPGKGKPRTYDLRELDTQLMFLPHTRLQLDVMATQPLAAAELVEKDQPPLPIELAGRSFSTRWEMQRSLALELRMRDRETGLASKPYFLSIGLLDDRAPRLTIRSTGVGRRVTGQARLPLSMHVVDDFGIVQVDLETERTVAVAEKVQTGRDRFEIAKATADMSEEEAKTWDPEYRFSVAKAKVTPGSVLKVRAAAKDGCLTGPQTGFSRWVVFQVVTPEELFYEILMRQREQRARFAAALANSRTQLAAAKEAKTPADAAALGRKHQLIARQVWQIASQLDASLEEMTLNELGSPQARELLEQTIIVPMRKLHEEQMSRLKSDYDAIAASSQIVDAKRKKAVELQEQVVATMQRILERMSQWESFVDVINQLREIMKLQNHLLETTEKMKKQRLDDVFDR